MPSPESVELAQLFFRKGQEDLDALRVLIESDRIADTVVGFHAQQAVEKFAKAALAAREVVIPKTHDLRFLLELADEHGIAVPDEVRHARWLTPWSVEFRYGDELTDPLDRSAAVESAEHLEQWAAALLDELADSSA